jgi:dipeptidyl aminopeptidase/acylaminoacyl peptidase
LTSHQKRRGLKIFLFLLLPLQISPSISLARHVQNDGQGEDKKGPEDPPPSENSSTNDERSEAEGVSTVPNAPPLGKTDSLGLSQDPCQGKNTVAALLQTPLVTAMEPAPSGGIFFLSDRGSGPQANFQKAANAEVTELPPLEQGIRLFVSSPDGTKLAAVPQNNSGVYVWEMGNPAWKVVPRVPGNTLSLVWDPDGKSFWFTASERSNADYDLYWYELATGKQTKQADLGGIERVVDISANRKWLSLTHEQSRTQSEILIFDVAKHSTSPLKAQPGIYREPHFTSDSRSLFFISDYLRDAERLYVTPVERFRPRLFYAIRGQVDQFRLDRRRTHIAILGNDQGFSTFYSFLLDADGGKQRLLLLPDIFPSVLSSLQFQIGGDEGLFYLSASATQPSEIWRFVFAAAPKSGRKEKWTNNAKELKSECFQYARLTTYPTFDKRTIAAFIYRKERVKTPFLLYLEGDPETQHRPTFHPVLQYFLSRGYSILAPNPRGRGGYGREFRSLDDYKKREDTSRDLIEGARWLIEHNYPNQDRLFLYGTGVSGWTALKAAELMPSLFLGCAEVTGIFNWTTYLKRTPPGWAQYEASEYGPPSDTAFFQTLSGESLVKSYQVPTVFLTGVSDRTPEKDTKAFAAALTLKGIENEVISLGIRDPLSLSQSLEAAKQAVYFFDAQKKKKGP